MKVTIPESKIKPLLKLAPEQLDLRTLDTNLVLNFLDEQIKLRDLPIEAHLKKAFKR